MSTARNAVTAEAGNGSATIRARVGDSAIDKVTRLFSAGLADIFTETLQNSRRGGANRVAATIEQDGDTTRVILADDGAGIADPAVLLTFGESDWKAGIAEAEDPAGFGLLALSRRGCTLRWRVPGQDPSPGYRLVLEPAHFLGRDAAHVVPDDSAPWPHGTAVTFEASEAPHAVRAFLETAARHYPLPVTIGGESVERCAFLDDALHAEPWKGLVFGVFKDSHAGYRVPDINFHGLTLPVQGEPLEARPAANDNALARIARDIRRTAFGWRHAQAVASFVDGRRQVLTAYDDLRERTRAEGDSVALSGAFQETLTRHAVLLKQAEIFRARPGDFASLLAQRGGIGRKDLDAFEDLHTRARRHRRASTMRYVHRIKREAEQQGIEPKRRQGVLPLGVGAVEPAVTVPDGRIQPAGPDGDRPCNPAHAPPPIETVAMPTERDPDVQPSPVAPAPSVKEPSTHTEEQIAWDTYSVLRHDWSRHLAAAERAGVHAIYVKGYKQLRARMEALAENPALEDRPRRSLGNVLAQLDEGTEIRGEIEDYLAAVKDRLEYRKQVLETVAIELGKPVTGLTGYGRWRAEIDRMAETGQRMMDDRDTYSPHLNGIPLGLEHLRWALTDIGRLIGQDGKQISEAAGHHRQGEEPATPETHEERQRRLLSEAQEFTRLLSATYDARSEEEVRAANKALDEYVEREAKNHETPEEQENQTHKRSRGQSIRAPLKILLFRASSI